MPPRLYAFPASSSSGFSRRQRPLRVEEPRVRDRAEQLRRVVAGRRPERGERALQLLRQAVEAALRRRRLDAAQQRLDRRVRWDPQVAGHELCQLRLRQVQLTLQDRRDRQTDLHQLHRVLAEQPPRRPDLPEDDRDPGDRARVELPAGGGSAKSRSIRFVDLQVELEAEQLRRRRRDPRERRTASSLRC
jgi:hypothetical protein